MGRGWLMTAFLLPIALLASAVSFPAMLFERAFPRWPSSEALIRGMPRLTWRTAYHHLKNITTECVRADAQWWSKFFCFALLVAVLT